MPRPSPQIERLLWLMKLFESEPRRSYNLAQLARHLGVTKATCLPMINELTRSGWLTRHPTRKTYRLGPAVIPLGKAAEQAGDLSDVTGVLLRQLAVDTGLVCTTWLPSGRDVQLGDIVGPSGALDSWTGLKPGHRLPVAPPLASALVTWDSEEAVDAWLARANYRNPDSARRRYLEGIEATRRRGFVVEFNTGELMHEVFFLVERLRAERNDRMAEVLSSVGTNLAQEINELETIATNIEEEREYHVVAVNAPVFGPSGNAELIVSANCDGPPISGTEVLRIGSLVRTVCEQLTTTIDGEWPSDARA